MSDLPTQGLLQQIHAREVSGEHLEVLGKKAAALWGEGRSKSLNEAVVETVKHAGLSPEQVKRVVEFTNTAAYLTEFHKEGTGHKVVDFANGPANPSAVLQDLNDGGGGSVFDPGTGDYNQPPKEKRSSDARGDAALAQMFAAEDRSYPEHNPFSTTMDLRDKLASVYETTTSQLSTLENMFSDLSDRVFHQVKQAALQGHSLSEIAEIWKNVAPSDEHVKVAFRQFVPRLVDNGVFRSHEDVVASLEKVAYVGLVNEEHPLVDEFKEYCEVLSKIAEVREMQNEAGEGVARITAFLKGASGEGLLERGVNLLDRGSRAAGRAGEWAGDALLGQGKGKYVGEAARLGTKYVLPAVGVNEVYRRTLKHNPGFQKAKSTVVGAVPGTSEYNQKEMELQMQAQGYGQGMGY